MTTEKISAEITEEIDRYEEMVRKFRAGEVSQETFQRFRLQHGVYGQRQDGVQMIRIKIPLGMLNSEQIECIADLAESIAHNNAHVTTRQDIQIHYVKLENTPMLMRKLAAVGITTREACGNTVRNVTAVPSAGVDPKEVFDVTPYAHALTYYFLRNPVCQNLPRKFKVAFDGGGVVTSYPKIHDVGLIAKVRNISPSPRPSPTRGEGEKPTPSLEGRGKGEGGVRRGFEVWVGGGLGSSPKMAHKIFDFLPAEDLLRFGEATLRLFDRYGERKIRMKARMKFLVEKLGFEKFSEAVKKEFDGVELSKETNDYLKHLDEWEEKAPVVQEKGVAPVAPTPEFLQWKTTNVWPQKQPGYSMVEIRLRTGDMTPKQMRPFAQLLRKYVGGKCRTMVHQNLLIRWVRDSDLPAFYQELAKIGFVHQDPQTIFDVTACPGTDTCRLGIASSMGLARVLEERLYQEDPAVTTLARDLKIKISGCPNSCGMHHIANIGFYGGAFPVNGHTVPAFQLMLGGSVGRDSAIATPICQIPSKNVPDAVARLLKNYAEKREGAESFNAFYGRTDKKAVVALLGELLTIPSYDEKKDLYVDWEDKKDFQLQKGVIGECAGAMVADVVPHVRDADEALQMAEAHLKHEQFESVAHRSYEAIIKAANGLLYHRLVQPFRDIESTHEFENHFVETGIISQWKGFHRQIETMRKKKADEKVAAEWLKLAKDFHQSCLAKEAEVVAASRRAKKQVPQPDNLFI